MAFAPFGQGNANRSSSTSSGYDLNALLAQAKASNDPSLTNVGISLLSKVGKLLNTGRAAVGGLEKYGMGDILSNMQKGINENLTEQDIQKEKLGRELTNSERILSFGSDIIHDPATYFTLGLSGLAKLATENGLQTLTRAGTEELASRTAVETAKTMETLGAEGVQQLAVSRGIPIEEVQASIKEAAAKAAADSLAKDVVNPAVDTTHLIDQGGLKVGIPFTYFNKTIVPQEDIYKGLSKVLQTADKVPVLGQATDATAKTLTNLFSKDPEINQALYRALKEDPSKLPRVLQDQQTYNFLKDTMNRSMNTEANRVAKEYYDLSKNTTSPDEMEQLWKTIESGKSYPAEFQNALNTYIKSRNKVLTTEQKLSDIVREGLAEDHPKYIAAQNKLYTAQSKMEAARNAVRSVDSQLFDRLDASNLRNLTPEEQMQAMVSAGEQATPVQRMARFMSHKSEQLAEGDIALGTKYQSMLGYIHRVLTKEAKEKILKRGGYDQMYQTLINGIGGAAKSRTTPALLDEAEKILQNAYQISGPVYERNVYKVMAERELQSQKAFYRQQFFQGIASDPNIAIDVSGKKNFREVFTSTDGVRYRVPDVPYFQQNKIAVPEYISADLERTNNVLSRPNIVPEFLKVFDKVNSIYKFALTAPYPSFHVGNIMGGVYNNWLAGMGAADVHLYEQGSKLASLYEKMSKLDTGIRTNVIFHDRPLNTYSALVLDKPVTGRDFIREMPAASGYGENSLEQIQSRLRESAAVFKSNHAYTTYDRASANWFDAADALLGGKQISPSLIQNTEKLGKELEAAGEVRSADGTFTVNWKKPVKNRNLIGDGSAGLAPADAYRMRTLELYNDAHNLISRSLEASPRAVTKDVFTYFRPLDARTAASFDAPIYYDSVKDALYVNEMQLKDLWDNKATTTILPGQEFKTFEDFRDAAINTELLKIHESNLGIPKQVGEAIAATEATAKRPIKEFNDRQKLIDEMRKIKITDSRGRVWDGYEMVNNFDKFVNESGRNMDVASGIDRLAELDGKRKLTTELMSKMRAPYTLIENRIRLPLYMYSLGKSGSVEDAARNVFKYQFDYAPESMSRFEGTILRRIIPFYSWTRNNIPLQIMEIFKNPAKQLAALRSYSAFVDPDIRKQLSTYQQDQLILQNGTDENGNAKLISGLRLPIGDLANLTSSKLLSLVSPILRTPVELATNHSFYYDKPLDELGTTIAPKYANTPLADVVGVTPYVGYGGKTAYTANSRNAYLVDQIFGRASSQLQQVVSPDVEKGQNLMSTITGVKQVNKSAADLKSAKDNELAKNLAAILKNSGVVTEKSTYKYRQLTTQ